MGAFLRASGLAFLFVATGCSVEVETGQPGGTSSGSGTPGPWTTLIDGTWSLAGGTEGYWCTLKTIQEDTYVKAFRAQAPLGTHHTLLLRMSGTQPDGQAKCGPTLGADMLHASGVGSDDLVFPEGVAVKIPAGTQLLLNLHLFNVSMSPISGVSGTLVQTVPASQVTQVAEMVLGGTTSINVPPNGSQTTEGKCGFAGTSTIVTVWPHMHMFGTHMKVTYVGVAGSKVLHDGDYSFSNQKNFPIDPVTVSAGEGVQIACTFQNTTSQTITWGDSSKAEMCFAGLYRYPALTGTGCQ
jgi:hypothetical protein